MHKTSKQDADMIGAAFYIRKVKYTSETFTEKLTAILDGFPRLEDIHPFRRLPRLYTSISRF